MPHASARADAVDATTRALDPPLMAARIVRGAIASCGARGLERTNTMSVLWSGNSWRLRSINPWRRALETVGHSSTRLVVSFSAAKSRMLLARFAVIRKLRLNRRRPSPGYSSPATQRSMSRRRWSCAKTSLSRPARISTRPSTLPDPPGEVASASPMLIAGRAIWPMRTGTRTRGRAPMCGNTKRCLGITLKVLLSPARWAIVASATAGRARNSRDGAPRALDRIGILAWTRLGQASSGMVVVSDFDSASGGPGGLPARS